MTTVPKQKKTNFNTVKGKAWIRALKQSAIYRCDGIRVNLLFVKTNTPSLLPSRPSLPSCMQEEKEEQRDELGRPFLAVD